MTVYGVLLCGKVIFLFLISSEELQCLSQALCGFVQSLAALGTQHPVFSSSNSTKQSQNPKQEMSGPVGMKHCGVGFVGHFPVPFPYPPWCLHSWAPCQDRHHTRALAPLLRSAPLLLLQDEVQQALCQSGGQGFPFNLLKEER